MYSSSQDSKTQFSPSFIRASQIFLGLYLAIIIFSWQTPVLQVYDYLYSLNAFIIFYGQECKKQAEKLNNSSRQNVDLSPCGVPREESSSLRSTAASQPVNKIKRASYQRANETEPKKAEEEGTAMGLPVKNGQESDSDSVLMRESENTSETNFSSLMNDFMKFVEKAYQDIFDSVKNFPKMESFSYGILFIVVVINTMQAAITTIHSFKGTVINKTESVHRWILYLFVTLLSFALLVIIIKFASDVGETAKRTSILFNQALSQVDDRYRTSFTTEKVLDIHNVHL
jgi:hypothetical protein